MSNSKELPPTRVPNPANLIRKLTLTGLAIGLGLSNKGGSAIQEFSPGLLSDTPAPAVGNSPSSQDTENQVIPNETQEIASLRESIAGKFGIEIQTFDEISKVPDVKYLYGLFDTVLYPVHDWNKENLDLLDRVLSYLPESLYKPREDGETVHIILGPT